MSHRRQYVGQGYVGGNPLVPAPNPLGAVSTAVGAFPDFHVQGDVAKDLVTNTNLVQVGTAAQNFATTRLIDSAPRLPMVTGTLNFPATGDAFRAWDNTVNNLSLTQSMLLIATWKLRTVTTARNIAGKREVGVAGYELVHSASPDNKAQFTVMVAGQAAITAELVGPFLVEIWHTTVAVIDRVANRIGIGSTDEASLEAGNEQWKSITAGTIANAATWAVGAQRLQACDGEVLHVTQYFGSKVDALLASGKGPKLISRDAAKLMWLDDAFGRIT